jgi:hypothetical protein
MLRQQLPAHTEQQRDDSASSGDEPEPILQCLDLKLGPISGCSVASNQPHPDQEGGTKADHN